MQDKLKIAINARLVPGRGNGGTESVLRGLVGALGELDGPEEYAIIVSPEAPDWLDGVLGASQRTVVAPGPSGGARAGALHAARARLAKIDALVKAKRRIAKPPGPWREVPVSDGFVESLGCDFIHFPTQAFVLCSLPFIYNPHDLQHRHYPQFFSVTELAARDVIYRAGCRLAQAVAVGSNWIATDVEREFAVNRERIQVIPWAPPTQVIRLPSEEEIREVLARYKVQQPFALYPAMIWEHKNHVRLLEAIALLRDRDGVSVNLVCTGYKHERWWPQVEARLNALKLERQVMFLGSVSPEELRGLYRSSEFVVVPTLFEAASAPMFEAWHEGIPVACSNVTSLPEQASGAALIFDPLDVEAIATAVLRMSSDPNLRRRLAERGKRRLEDFSWTRTAQAYRALYRKVGRRKLSTDDEALLSWDWMKAGAQARAEEL